MRIALLQVTPGPDVAANLDRLEQAATAAVTDQGADLVVTPEMYLSGYNIGAAAIAERAEALSGPTVTAVNELARRLGVAVVTGLPEADDGAIYNTAVAIGPDGQLLASYRKAHLFGHLDGAQFTAGDEPSPTFELHGLRLGLAICFDIEFPEVARSMALAGVQVAVVPTANWVRSVNARLVPARAEENGFYVAYANYTGSEGDLEYCGQSCLVGPDGEDVVRAGDGEVLIAGEVTAAAITTARNQLDYLAQRRPDLYRHEAGRAQP